MTFIQNKRKKRKLRETTPTILTKSKFRCSKLRLLISFRPSLGRGSPGSVISAWFVSKASLDRAAETAESLLLLQSNGRYELLGTRGPPWTERLTRVGFGR